MDNRKTGELIAKARAERDLTQKELAQALHISDTTVSKWERGIGFPDVSLLEPLTQALGLTLAELFRGERNAATPEVEGMLADAVGVARAEKLKSVRRAFRTVCACLAVVLIVTALYFLFPSPTYLPLQGAYQSEMINGHTVLLSANQSDDFFVLFIDNREVDSGTVKELDEGVYILAGTEADTVVALRDQRTARLSIPGLIEGEPLTLKRLSTAMAFFGEPFGDEAEYKQYLH